MAEDMQLLDSALHRDLRMHAVGGQRPHMVQIVLAEVPHAATICPVLLAKSSETGQFSLVALFGFTIGEWLVDGAESGLPAFLPLDLQRQGFYAADASIAIDRAHPRFADGAAVALFDSHGEATPAMRKVQQAIGQLMAMGPPTQAFIDAAVALRLVEPIDIELRFDDGAGITLNGLYTISGDALSDLDDADIVRLFRKGWLQAAIAIRNSVHQIGTLARRRNEALGARAAAGASHAPLGKALAGWA
ncbi:MAG: SapC family protein [Novosphingobium meiothermophilum]|uniref:SapC family protein n=1 Tax=Novosphingobium TaxID=165696 RepID=UPI000D6E5D90|nr:MULTISPECIES: SapC family protein [Novosphingobium]